MTYTGRKVGKQYSSIHSGYRKTATERRAIRQRNTEHAQRYAAAAARWEADNA